MEDLGPVVGELGRLGVGDLGSVRASGTSAGFADITPLTSVQIQISSASSAAPRIEAE